MPNELGDDLGIGLAHEGVAQVLQLPPELVVVVEGAVVNDGDPPRGVHVGVGVLVGLAPVRGPAGVGDAHGCPPRSPRVRPEQVDAVGLVAVAGELGHDHAASTGG